MRGKRAPIFWIMLTLICSGFVVSGATNSAKDPLPSAEELVDTIACFRDLPSSTYNGAVNDQNFLAPQAPVGTRVVVMPRFRYHQEPEIYVYTTHHIYLYDLNGLKPQRALSGAREYRFYAPLTREGELKEIALAVKPATYFPESLEVYSVVQGEPLVHQTVPAKELSLDRKNFRRLRRALTAYVHGIVESFENRSNKLGRYISGAGVIEQTRGDALERAEALKKCYARLVVPSVRATVCNELDKLEGSAKEALAGKFQSPCSGLK